MLDLALSNDRANQTGLNGMFVESCLEHCAISSNGYYKYRINGVLVRDAVTAWWDDKPSESGHVYLPCDLNILGGPRQCNPSCSAPGLVRCENYC